LPKRPKSKDPKELAQQPESRQVSPRPNDGADTDPHTTKNDDPQSGRPDTSKPEQRDATQPPKVRPTGVFERSDLSGRWGVLPPKEAEDLQRRNADEFPQRYRLWMELYFRRVNRLPTQDH
jgi:hypothetical protein